MTVKAKTNDVDFRAVKAFIKGSKLNAADGFHAVFFPCFQKQFQPVYGIVVGEGNGGKTLLFGKNHQTFWRKRAVRAVRMGM